MASVATHEVLIGGVVAAQPRGRAGFIGAVRSEFTKIRSVRSTYWTLFALVVVCAGFGALICWARAEQIVRVGQVGGPGFRVRVQGGGGPPDAAQLSQAKAALRATVRASAANISLVGLLIGQLIIVVLGALTITSEYSTGMIRTSLSTMPRRGTVYAAKAVVFGAVALVTGLITSFLTFFIGQAILSSQQAGTSLGQPDVLRTVVGGGLFLAVCGLLSFGLGAILRHTAGAISAGIGLLFVVYILGNFLPGPPAGWYGAADVDKWLPFNAGAAIWARPGMLETNPFSPWIGFGVFCAYAAAAIGVGLILFRKRDA
jgi:ABC-type transport system involved in multi-copper enzyme maturation permease subunit